MKLSDTHAFFVYVFFGYLLVIPAVLVMLRLFAIQNPRQRLQAYLLALVTPFAGFVLYHTILTKRCQSGIFPVGYGWQLFNAFCRFGTAAVRYLGPLLLVLLLAGFLKAVAGLILVARMRRRAVEIPVDEKARVNRILTQQCSLLGLDVPEVIYSGRDNFTAFAAGFWRPVIAVSAPLLPAFSDRELKEILTHELVHILNGDTISIWLAHLAMDATFFSPFSRMLLNRYLLEKERLCDQETVRLTGCARDYASTLLKVWRLLIERQSGKPALAAGFTSRGSDLEQRVKSLLEEAPSVSQVPALLFVSLLFFLFAVTILYLGFIC